MTPLEGLLQNANIGPIAEPAVRKALATYSPLKDHPPSADEKSLLEAHHLFLGRHEISHDSALAEARRLARLCDRKTLAGNFVASIGNGRFELRGGLVAWAILAQMPDHDGPYNEARYCQVCSSLEQATADLTFFNRIRFSVGCLISTRMTELWFNIAMAHKTPAVQPEDRDVNELANLLRVIKRAPADTKPIELLKMIKDVFPYKSTTEQKRALLDQLGALSILETPLHKGFLHHYVDVGRAATKSRSSDWAYPVDWWTGADGVNQNAVEHWFGEWL